MSIDLLKLIHGTEVKPESMPDMMQIAQGWANELEGLLDAPLLEKLRALIDAVPDDNHMLHGDYHIKNVMYQNGESLLIDMDTLCHGHPIFELGSIYNAYVGFLALDHSVADRFLGIPYETATELWNRELRLYLDGADEDKVREVERKAILIGNARICRRAHRRGETDMYEYSRSILEDLIPQIDTLTF